MKYVNSLMVVPVGACIVWLLLADGFVAKFMVGLNAGWAVHEWHVERWRRVNKIIDDMGDTLGIPREP